MRRGAVNSSAAPRRDRGLCSHSGNLRFAGHTLRSVPVKYVVAAFILLPCISSCTSSSARISPTHDDDASHDPGKAHELTLEALDVIESDSAKAEELLNAALKADLYHGPAHNDLGVLYLRQSRLYEAANEFELARKLMPGNPDPRLNLGLTLEKAGLNERAFDAYNAALEVSPEHIRTIQAIARLTLRTDRKNDRLMGMLEDITLRGETNHWRHWAQDQMSRSKIATGKTSLLRVTTPRTGNTVTSPLRVSGEARGTWFFEANFPVRLLNQDGQEIAIAPAEARGEWMTENFVPFEAVLEFSAPAPGTSGTLVLEKNNPSGLSEQADEFLMPVRFGTTEPGESSAGVSLVQAYFGNHGMAVDAKGDCEAIFPVVRTVPRTQGPARAALEALLAGPTPEEKAQGYFTSIDAGVRVRGLVIKNGVATVDFSEEMERAGDSCRMSAIRAQIDASLRQFPTVQSVRISIVGKTENILQP